MRLFTKVIGVISVALITLPARGQTHFHALQRTGDNATIGIPTAVRPSIDSLPLVNGDEIAAFTQEGLCVGVVVWNDSGAALTAWGDDAFTPAVDGMVAGDSLCYRVWSNSAHTEYTDVDVTYLNGDGLYVDNGVFQVASMRAEGDCSVTIDSLHVDVIADGSARVRWWTSEEGETEAFDVQRSTTAVGGFVCVDNGTQSAHPQSTTLREYEVTDTAKTFGRLYYRICVKYMDGTSFVTASQPVDVLAAVGGSRPVAGAFSLMQNYPNPFNPTTVISGEWTADSEVKLVVYDLLGREVAVLANGRYPAGRYSFTFDGAALASGIYLYRLTAGSNGETRKMILAK